MIPITHRLYAAAFVAAMSTLILFAEGELKMPMLNWMGREKATNAVKDVAMKILREDGSIWISIDDREGAYLRVICDEIFGRQNFVSNISW